MCKLYSCLIGRTTVTSANAPNDKRYKTHSLFVKKYTSTLVAHAKFPLEYTLTSQSFSRSHDEFCTQKKEKSSLHLTQQVDLVLSILSI